MPLTRRLILQKARHHTTNGRSDGLTAHGFRYYFTPLPGYFSPFPHGTDSLSVTRKYLDLPGGPGRFTRDSTSPVLLGWHTRGLTHYDYRTLTLSGRPSQGVHLHARTSRQQPVETVTRTPTTPMMQPSTGITHHRFSLFRFRSPLLTESFVIFSS